MAPVTEQQPFIPDVEGDIDRLYDTWMSLGVGMNGRRYVNDADLELAIAETTRIGRYESRLMWAMLAWISAYGDLINVSRMMHFLSKADSAVLGAVCEIAAGNGADRKLIHIVNKCTPRIPPDVLFVRMKSYGFSYAQELADAKEEWSKWGYFCAEVSASREAPLGSRQMVFKRNRNLALRAIFGPNLRAEILHFLSRKSTSSISEISRATGFAYCPTYNEVRDLVRNGILRSVTCGRTRVVSLNDAMRRFLEQADRATK